MNHDENDITKVRQKAAVLERALVTAHATAIATQYLGDSEYHPIVAAHLRVKFDGESAAVFVADEKGNKRRRFDAQSMKWRDDTGGDLAADLKAKWPQLARIGTDKKPTDTGKGTNQTVTELLRAQAAKLAVERAAEDAAFLTHMRRANPFATATWNLTHQMKTLRLDRKLADELKAAA